MFSPYSWLDFILVVIAAVPIYYIIIGVTCFRSELSDLLSGKLIKAKPAQVSTSAKASAGDIIGGYKEKPDPLALEGVTFKSPENLAGRDVLKEAAHLPKASTSPLPSAEPLSADSLSQQEKEQEKEQELLEIENGAANIPLTSSVVVLEEQPLEAEEKSMMDSDLFIKMIYDGSYLEQVTTQSNDSYQKAENEKADEPDYEPAGEKDDWGAANF